MELGSRVLRPVTALVKSSPHPFHICFLQDAIPGFSPFFLTSSFPQRPDGSRWHRAWSCQGDFRLLEHHARSVPSVPRVAPSQESLSELFMSECDQLSPQFLLLSTSRHSRPARPALWLYRVYPEDFGICHSGPVFSLHFTLMYPSTCPRDIFLY